ncbi:uncharacterized protein LY79DRAFT_684236 [Colletotrichum navitas]|uniref:Uncharacterized protein n=1 Tax=Colletotrichum navitas TaxID=681940 RepID=A0AAD8V702_9PEZI|nr:uncharacterized protein LY79DRAFT_684236 [Colletotrichum navitas]KAK1594141.1 hypothetical protein LY79DRAFT_684236 [Colletotrichum navitas]
MLVFLQPAFPGPANSSADRRLFLYRGAARLTVRRLNDQGRAMHRVEPQDHKVVYSAGVVLAPPPPPDLPISRLPSPISRTAPNLGREDADCD